MHDQFYFLDIVDSTNRYANDLLASNPENYTTIVAGFQIAGRGQQQNKWQSNDGENLLMSTIVKPKQLNTSNIYALYMASSLAVCDTIDKHISKKSVIKWPNDILVDNAKIAGILIENSIRGALIQDCIMGVGLNVNQHQFGTYHIPATSMHQITGSKFDTKELAYLLLHHVKKYMTLIDDGQFEQLRQLYFSKLFGYKSVVSFRKNGSVIKGKIIDISEQGALIVLFVGDNLQRQTSIFQPKEIEFVFE